MNRGVFPEDIASICKVLVSMCVGNREAKKKEKTAYSCSNTQKRRGGEDMTSGICSTILFSAM